MAFNYQLEPNGETGKRLTILSIEGGGVRGIIPARILEELEDQLKVKVLGAHPTKKCRFFTHPTHPKNWQFQYIVSALTSGFSSQ
jgi:patatin-like phospholipase/acyl hydrolase